MSQTNLNNFRQLEYKSLFYQELIEGISAFEHLERMFEDLDLLTSQHNLLGAAVKLQTLKKSLQDPDLKSMVGEFGMSEVIRKRVSEKQRSVSELITSDLRDLVFARYDETCERKMQLIAQYFEPKLLKLDTEENILEHISKETLDLKRMQDQIQKIHNKELESANKALQLIRTQCESPDELVTTALLCLQRDSTKNIQDQNVAYLTLLIVAYQKVNEDSSLQDYLRCILDTQMMQLVQRLLQLLVSTYSDTQKQSSFFQVKDNILGELIQISGQELKKATIIIQQFFFFFQHNLSLFMIIDKQCELGMSEEGISMEYVNDFFYYFKFLIQILFDHDRRIKDFNSKNGISTDQTAPIVRKPMVEKNLRFSFRNKEDMESFLVDSVRLKLDFYKTMEEMIVPFLFKKNISFVMTLGTRLMNMIDGMSNMVTANFTKESSNKQQVQAFNGWMRRFIVTNYEIYLDYYKQHSEFVGQKYFNKSFNTGNLVKTGVTEEKILLGQSQTFMNNNSNNQNAMQMKASIIGRFNTQDQGSMWCIFEYIHDFSYVAQLSVEMIPLEDKQKQDQAMFRQEVLDSLNKVIKKVHDKMSQVVGLCLKNSHRDVLFPLACYEQEKTNYFFKTLILKQESSKATLDSLIDTQDFLFKPKLAIQNELLSNSMTTLTLLMQIYSKLTSTALQEFKSCYLFITGGKLWDQLLSEAPKKEYTRGISECEVLVHDILLFLRCELSARAFTHMREMTRIDLCGIAASQSRVEPFIQSLIRDVKILSNFVSQYLEQLEVISVFQLIQVFYLLASLELLVFKLYGAYIKYIKRQELDEVGHQRLKKSLFTLKVELDMIVPKILNQNTPIIKKSIDEMRQQIAREYEKSIYILQLLACDSADMEDRLKENDYNLTSEDIQSLAPIQDSYQRNQQNSRLMSNS